MCCYKCDVLEAKVRAMEGPFYAWKVLRQNRRSMIHDYEFGSGHHVCKDVLETYDPKNPRGFHVFLRPAVIQGSEFQVRVTVDPTKMLAAGSTHEGPGLAVDKETPNWPIDGVFSELHISPGDWTHMQHNPRWLSPNW
jgi:hypothetical protein